MIERFPRLVLILLTSSSFVERSFITLCSLKTYFRSIMIMCHIRVDELKSWVSLRLGTSSFVMTHENGLLDYLNTFLH